MPSANKTPNIGLNQWKGNEYAKRQDFNDDNLIVDKEIKKLAKSIQEVEVPVTSVNDKTGDVVLSATDVGAETPSGAQAKATEALNSAKVYTELAVNDIFNDLKTHKENDITKTGGTFTGIVTAHSNTSYTVRQVRNIITSPNDADVNAMQNGDIWIKYK